MWSTVGIYKNCVELIPWPTEASPDSLLFSWLRCAMYAQEHACMLHASMPSYLTHLCFLHCFEMCGCFQRLPAWRNGGELEVELQHLRSARLLSLPT